MQQSKKESKKWQDKAKYIKNLIVEIKFTHTRSIKTLLALVLNLLIPRIFQCIWMHVIELTFPLVIYFAVLLHLTLNRFLTQYEMHSKNLHSHFLQYALHVVCSARIPTEVII